MIIVMRVLMSIMLGMRSDNKLNVVTSFKKRLRNPFGNMCNFYVSCFEVLT